MDTVATFRIELPEGNLDIHDLTIGMAAGEAPAVIAVHGITANGLTWQCVADEVFRRRGPGAVRFLAPDLRGRGGSRTAPGPYGLGVHAGDLAAIADVFGARPLLVGHSMGAFVCALAVASHPHRFAGAVLVDGGLALPVPDALDIDAALQAVVGPAMDRLRMRFPSPEAYLEFWSAHPGLGRSLTGPEGPAVRRYLLHDLVPADDGRGGLVSSCVLDAVRADGAGVLAGPGAQSAVRAAVEAGVPIELLWAQRGLLDEPQGLYDEARLAALGVPKAVTVTPVPDTNHYSVIFGATGVGRVVDAIERQLDRARR